MQLLSCKLHQQEEQKYLTTAMAMQNDCTCTGHLLFGYWYQLGRQRQYTQ